MCHYWRTCHQKCMKHSLKLRTHQVKIVRKPQHALKNGIQIMRCKAIMHFGESDRIVAAVEANRHKLRQTFNPMFEAYLVDWFRCLGRANYACVVTCNFSNLRNLPRGFEAAKEKSCETYTSDRLPHLISCPFNVKLRKFSQSKKRDVLPLRWCWRNIFSLTFTSWMQMMRAHWGKQWELYHEFFQYNSVCKQLQIKRVSARCIVRIKCKNFFQIDFEFLRNVFGQLVDFWNKILFVHDFFLVRSSQAWSVNLLYANHVAAFNEVKEKFPTIMFPMNSAFDDSSSIFASINFACVEVNKASGMECMASFTTGQRKNEIINK